MWESLFLAQGFQKNIYILMGYTVPKKRNVNSVMGKNNKCKKLFYNRLY